MRFTSGPRRGHRLVKRARTEKLVPDSVPDEHLPYVEKCELDSHADTICAGRNCRLLSSTGQCCDVKGFHEDLADVKNIPVGTVVTGVISPEGVTLILVMHEVLYFGESMDHSLINPNQIRHYGINVSDNPYDSDKPFGIDHETAFIPFSTAGTTIYFDSFYPTNEQLETELYVTLTSDYDWIPASVDISHNGCQNDYEISINAVSKENKRRRSGPVEFETDLVLGSVGGDLVQGTLLERMIASVKVTADTAGTKKARGHRKRFIGKVAIGTRHSVVTPERVADVMGIGIEKAKHMMKKTTQRGVRTAVYPIHKRYRTDTIRLKSNHLTGKWYFDWMPAKCESICGAKGAYVMTNGSFTEAYPCPSKNNEMARDCLQRFIDDVGVPGDLKTDRAPELVGKNSKFLALMRREGIKPRSSEKGRSNQMHSINLEIREVKKRYHKKMRESGVPRRLWDYGVKHTTKLGQFIPRNKLDMRTPWESVTGNTPDISEYLDFDFYDLVWYFPTVHASISDDDRELARWIGVAHRIGSDMCYWLMPVSGVPVANTTVQHVTRDDMLDPDIKRDILQFDVELRERLNDENFKLESNLNNYSVRDVCDDFFKPYGDPAYGDNTPEDEEYGNMSTEFRTFVDAKGKVHVHDDSTETVNIDEPDVYDKYIGCRVVMDEATNSGGNLVTVKRRATDDRGNGLGTAHNNPMLDTRQYDVELEDGTSDRIFANKIAANIYSQVDDEGREVMMFREIIDHSWDDDAVTNDSDNGNGRHKPSSKSTKGWWVNVEMADDSTHWVPLRDVKESNPVEMAEYAVANGIDDEPAFNWWVQYVLRKRERSISKVKAKYWRTTHKYGVRMPKSINHAMILDRENDNHFWENALNKEMSKAKVAYEEVKGCTKEEVRKGEVNSLKGFTEIRCHVIFDVKMDFTRKARFVADGSKTETPSAVCYSSVVSRESVRLAFLVAAFHELDVFSCDIGNAYLNAPCRERIWFVAGAECGSHVKGKVMKLVRALYGLKSSGASWRKMFKDYIVSKMGFVPSSLDGDMYYRRNADVNGVHYYELLLVYVDDVLAISHDPGAIMKTIGLGFVIKNDEWGPPKQYLGADIEQFDLPEGRKAWSIHCTTYIKSAIETVKDLLAEDNRKLKGPNNKGRHAGALPTNYKPELDVTDECNADDMSRFQQLIGILRWAVELGRIDIHLEVALMSQYQSSPRYGHLEALYSIFHYLMRFPKKRLVMDPIGIPCDEQHFNNISTTEDWREFYGDVKEEDPPRMPEPLGPPIKMLAFVDSDHAGNVVTRRSHSGFFIFLQNALMYSFSKKQNTVEASTYGSELVALRQVRDKIIELRLKCKSIGLPLDGPTDVYCDNQGVVKNTSIPESTLSKKHNAVNYHICRETVAADAMRVGKEDTETNCSDALTKLMPYSRKHKLLGKVQYDY